MKRAAQAGLEYLMTYGWALVLIATIVGVLVFVAVPVSNVSFTSSDQAKILLKEGGMDASGNVVVLAQNITGGQIRVTSFSLSGGFVGGTLNGVESSEIGASSPLVVPGGGSLRFEGVEYVGLGIVDASLSITYTDASGLQRNASISAKGTAPATAEAINQCGVDLAGGKNYVLSQNLTAGSGQTCINITGSNVILNCDGKSITGPGGGVFNGNSRGILGGSLQNVTVTNCTVSDFGNAGIYLYGANASNVTVSNSTSSSNYYYGILAGGFGSSNVKLLNNEANGNRYGIYLYAAYSSDGMAKGNSAAGNNGYGMHVYAYFSSDVTVADNTSTGSSSDGIYFDGVNSAGASVTGNTSTSSGSNGIFFFGFSSTGAAITGNTATGNCLSGPTGGGIYIFYGSPNLSNNRSCNTACLPASDGYDITCDSATVSGSGNVADSTNCAGISPSGCP